MALDNLKQTDITTLPSGDIIATPCVPESATFASSYVALRLDDGGSGGGFHTITLGSLQTNKIGLVCETKPGDAEQNKLLKDWGPLEFELKITTGNSAVRLTNVYVAIMDVEGNVHYCVGTVHMTPHEPMLVGTYTIEVPIDFDFYGLDLNYTLYWSFRFRNYATGNQSITLQTGQTVVLSAEYFPITFPIPSKITCEANAGSLTHEIEMEGTGDIDELTASATASGDVELDGLAIMEEGTSTAGATSEFELEGSGELEASASGLASTESEIQGTGELELEGFASASTELEIEGLGELILEATAVALGTAILEDASILDGTYEEIANAVRGFFMASIRGIPIVWDNAPDPHTDSLFVRVRVQFRPERTFRVRKHTKFGELVVSVYAPANSGTAASMQKVDLIADAFRVTDINDIRFDTPKLRRIGREGAWYRNDVTCPFRYVA